MTRGKNARTTVNSRPEIQREPLTGCPGEEVRTLVQQVADLAARIAALEERVDRLDGIPPDYFYTGIEEPKPNKPGPDKGIEDAELFRSRDGLVGWLEGVWPEIVRPLYATSDPRKVAAILKSVARPRNSQPPWQSRFLRHPAKLVNFLKSKKFRKKPPRKTVVDALGFTLEDERRIRAANRLPTRQIANAMAGVPELSWRTSLDRCSKNPCSYLVTIGTAQHYREMYGIAQPE